MCVGERSPTSAVLLASEAVGRAVDGEERLAARQK
jgi:hypothetical protein